MAATAGYNTTLYITGTPTTMTLEACTEVVAGPPQTFRITNAAKRCIDPATPVVIRDVVGGSQDPGDPDVTADFTIDYLTGEVTSQGGGYVSVSVSGKFLPMLAVAEGRSTTATPTRAELDTSVFGESFTKLILGKKSAAGDITLLAPLEQDLDGGAGTRSWKDVFDNATSVVIDVRTVPTSTVRAWMLVPSLSTKIDQAGLVENTITWKSIDKRATDGTECGVAVFDPTL